MECIKRLPTTIKLLNLTKSQQLIVFGIKNFGIFNPFKPISQLIDEMTFRF